MWHSVVVVIICSLHCSPNISTPSPDNLENGNMEISDTRYFYGVEAGDDGDDEEEEESKGGNDSEEEMEVRTEEEGIQEL